MSFNGVACVRQPRLIPGIFTDVQKYSTLGKFKYTKLKLSRLSVI